MEYLNDIPSKTLIPTSTDVTDLPGTSNQTRIVSSSTHKPDRSPINKIYSELTSFAAESKAGLMRFSPGSTPDFQRTVIVPPSEMYSSEPTSPADVNHTFIPRQNNSLEVSNFMEKFMSVS